MRMKFLWSFKLPERSPGLHPGLFGGGALFECLFVFLFFVFFDCLFCFGLVFSLNSRTHFVDEVGLQLTGICLSNLV